MGSGTRQSEQAIVATDAEDRAMASGCSTPHQSIMDIKDHIVVGLNCAKSDVVSVVVPPGVEVIGDEVFSGCTMLTSLTLPETLKKIGKRAFAQCSGLTSVTFPKSLSTLEEAAFIQCTGLVSVTLPHTLSDANDKAFYGCGGLTVMSSKSFANFFIEDLNYRERWYVGSRIISNKQDIAGADVGEPAMPSECPTPDKKALVCVRACALVYVCACVRFLCPFLFLCLRLHLS